MSLRAHLVRTRLAGDVATSPGNTRANCGRLIEGHTDYTFGLSDWRSAQRGDVEAAVAELCGAAAVERGDHEPGWIDPDRALAQIDRQRWLLADAAANGSRVLLATGHPTGLLGHYAAIARALSAAGAQVVTPLDDVRDLMDQHDRKLGVRFVERVACAWYGGDLVHTHRSALMEAMLDDLESTRQAPDLVVGDHGFAGAAIERGLPTLSIADVNDPALMLAMARGRTEAVLSIDDNLAPAVYAPVTAAMLDWSAPPRIE